MTRPRAPSAEQLPADRQARLQQRQDQAQKTRKQWQNQREEFYDDLFEPGWRLEYPQLSRGYFNYHHPNSEYWWAAATFAAVASWTGDSSSEEADYDYGSTVVYQGETVVVDGQPAGTATQYAEGATAIADSGSDALAAADAQNRNVEWLPLGVFALTTEQGSEPTKFLQLAVSKEGLIAGTYYNALTKDAQPVEGAVDKATQRAAWTAGENKNTVMEAGIYNLTQDQATALVHFGTERQQQVLLVRLPEKEQPAQ